MDLAGGQGEQPRSEAAVLNWTISVRTTRMIITRSVTCVALVVQTWQLRRRVVGVHKEAPCCGR